MQRSNCGGTWNGNELVRCLKFPWRKMGRVLGEREKGGSEQTAHGRRKGGEHPCARRRAGASGSRKRELRQLVCCVLLCQRFTQAPAIYS